MDPALFLLQRMRFFAWFRRIGRKLSTPRGVILTLFGLLFFVFQFSFLFFSPAKLANSEVALDMTRRLGPVALLGYCLLTLVFSPGDQAFAFNRAEISFLFPAPFTRRQLLLYKISGIIGLTSISALMLTCMMRSNASYFFSRFVGLVLTFSFLQLFGIAVTLVGMSIGAAASSLRRRLALGLIVALVMGILVSTGGNAIRHLDLQKLKNLEHSPFVQVVLAPFRPFSQTLTSRTLVDLIRWGSAALAINLALVVTIVLLDAQFLESVTTSSERLYAKIERIRKGGPAIRDSRKPHKPPRSLPSFPWWGGVGPIFWRQFLMALRDYSRLLVAWVAVSAFVVMGIALSHQENDPYRFIRGSMIAVMLSGTILALSVLFTPMFTFDFRGDFARIEGLKSLPISAERLALGQLMTPLFMATFPQALGILIIAIGTWPVSPLLWAVLAFAAPMNALLLEVENLMFLWFPSRPMAHTPGDIQAMGRSLLLMLAKMFTIAFAAGIAALFGFGVYFLAGWPGAIITSWCVTMGFVMLLIPFLAEAFRKFDVASDTPA